MGHATDRPILEEIFRQGRHPAYLGVIGSEAKRKVMLRELADAGIARRVGRAIPLPDRPAIGNNQPGEIAISVAAELIQVRDAISHATTGAALSSCRSARRPRAFPIASHTLGSTSLLITCTEPSQNIKLTPCGCSLLASST